MIFLIYLVSFLLALTILLVAFVVIYVLFNVFFILFFTAAPPVQTERRYFHQIFSQYRITPNTVIYDLGCGGGNFLMAAAKFEPKKCVGYELSLMPYFQAWVKSLFEGRGLVKILFQDFFKANIREADLVYVYLVPSLLGRVAQKLKHEMRPGAVAIVKGQPLPEMTYVNKITLDNKRGYYAYIYKF